MNLNQRLIIWLLLMTAMFTGSSMWSYGHLQSQKRLAEISARNQSKCQQIAQAIDDIRQHAQDIEPADDMNSLVQQIQKAASSANMPMQHVQRIRPSSPRRLGQSPYVQKATQLSLQDVTMQNAITFLHHLAMSQPNLNIQSMRITSPRSYQQETSATNTGETWKMEVGIASIAYVPEVKKRNNGQ